MVRSIAQLDGALSLGTDGGEDFGEPTAADFRAVDF